MLHVLVYDTVDRRTLENVKRGLSDSVKKLQRAKKGAQDRGMYVYLSPIHVTIFRRENYLRCHYRG